jgi:hypothetical protein
MLSASRGLHVQEKSLEFDMKDIQHDAAAAVLAVASEMPPISDESNRARIIRSLIKTRARLQEARNRSAELQSALEVFKHKQAQIGGG